MININKTHYFHITKKVIQEKNDNWVKEAFEPFANGIIEKQGATLTIDSGIEIGEIAGFFSMMAETLAFAAHQEKLKKSMPPELATLLEKLGEDFLVHVQEIKPEGNLLDSLHNLFGCKDPECKVHGTNKKE